MQNDNSPAHSHYNQNSRLHDITLAQMVSQTVWRLSESTVIQWEPRYFNETVNGILESIDTSRFQNAKGNFCIFPIISLIFGENVKKPELIVAFLRYSFREAEENVENIVHSREGTQCRNRRDR